jgi:hypothetical protein
MKGRTLFLPMQGAVGRRLLSMLKIKWMSGAVLSLSVFCSNGFAATYYVSPSGDDASAGTSEEKPFQSVQQAVDRMRSGDTLVVMDGFYTGMLKLKSGITLKAQNPRKVVFSGAVPLSGSFEKHAGAIYKIEVEDGIKQLFYKNQPMTWACWPNLMWSENWIGGKKWASSAKGTGPGVLTSEAFSEMKGLDLSGGYCFLRYSKGNSCFSRAIESFDGQVLAWDDTNFYSVPFSGEDGRKGSPGAIEKGKSKENVRARFFLAGTLSLLDSEGEWVETDGTLYFHAPGGRKPDAEDVLCKVNDYSIYEEDAIHDLAIEGIDFFATSIHLENPENKNIGFRDVYFTYIGTELLFKDQPTGQKIAKPIHVEGSLIDFDRCLFAGAQNTALSLAGSELTVQNCVFAENNRHANFQSVALLVSARGAFKITRNTFFNNCSDAIRVGFDEDQYKESENPDISYNNVCNAGVYNSDVSGVYMPHLSQHWTEFHHNWVHNVKGNGVRLDQAGEKLSVHHNVFWSSKRGLNIEGYGNFNIYNNTSVMNAEPCALTRNVVGKRKGTGDADVSNDTSFPPITDWNVLNNLVTDFIDRIGPSEDGAYFQSKAKGTLNPERAQNKSLPIQDRGAIQGNMTGFSQTLFVEGEKDGLNLIPAKSIVRNGKSPTSKLKAQGVTDLDTFRGAYDYQDKGWSTGSNWMPYDLEVPETMAESEEFAEKYDALSLVPEVNLKGLPNGILSPDSKWISTDDPDQDVPKKSKKKNKG